MSTQPRTYVTPRGVLRGAAARSLMAAGLGRPLPSETAAFSAIEVTAVVGHTVHATMKAAIGADAGAYDAVLSTIASARPPFAGLALDRPRLMGIVNVTPDSFSDGGRFAAADAAIDHGVSLAEAGAEIIDIGGESTRPGAMPVAPDDEARRVLPVISALANRGLLVSADTRNAATMATAIAAGARIVNDVAALRGEGALEAVRQSAASVVLMHMLGDPRTMQAQPRYAWAPGDIFDFLAARVAACQAAGIERSRIAVDPGIGFGQNDLHIAQVMDHLAMLHGLGCAVAVGASRKGFIGRWSRGEGPDQRLAGSLAAVLAAVAEGVQIIRVHDVAETRQALAVASRLGS